MASVAAAPQASSILSSIANQTRRRRSKFGGSSSVDFFTQRAIIKTSRTTHVQVLAAAGGGGAADDLNKSGVSDGGVKKGSTVDTRIHWESEDEGWLGVGKGKDEQKSAQEQVLEPNLNFPDLLNTSTDSHYQFLGVPAEADMEEIKVAYRRLSKEYHPDTTSLPLKAASEKFMKLREVYNVLSNEETRTFYDWTLAQEVAARESEKLRIKLEDPYDQDLKNFVSVPDMVDRLQGRNMKLSDQALSALTIDIAIIAFSICCLIYVIYFKEPY